MWLFTRHGFYSVVRDKKNARCVHIRARIKDDLERLKQFAHDTASIELPEIIATPDADYGYRAVIEQRIWVRLAARLTEDIDYPNFKSEVHGEGDRDRAYFDVWSAMNALQSKRKRQADAPH